MSFRRWKPLLCAAFLVGGAGARLFAQMPTPGTPPRIFMAGDSTMANKNVAHGNLERGWGQLLPEQFKDGVLIDNRASDGRSTRSFAAEGRWKAIVDQLRAGDWVIIQFGHNDQKKDKPELYAEAETDYRAALAGFVRDCQQKGANPILATSIYRRFFSADGKSKDSLGKYPQACSETAAELKVPLADLHERTRQLLEKLGPEKSQALFMIFQPGENPALPAGKQDNTHLRESGARAVAGLFADELRRLHSPLCVWLKDAPAAAATPHE